MCILSPLITGTRQWCPQSTFQFFPVLPSVIRKKRNKMDIHLSGRNKTVSICKWHEFYIENLKESTKNKNPRSKKCV